jgi:hypothetical protein
VDLIEDYRRKYPQLPLATLVRAYLKRTVLGKRRAQLAKRWPFFISQVGIDRPYAQGSLNMLTSLYCSDYTDEGLVPEAFRRVKLIVGWLSPAGEFVELEQPQTNCELCEHQMACALEGKITAHFKFIHAAQWPETYEAERRRVGALAMRELNQP